MKQAIIDGLALVINIGTLSGWIVSAILQNTSESGQGAIRTGIVLGAIFVSYKTLILLLFGIGIITLNAYLFRRLLKGAANSTADYKVVCDKLPDDLQKELYAKDKASPYVNQAAAEFCQAMDNNGFKNLLNSRDATCKNLNAGSKKGKTILQCSFIPVDANKNTIIIRRRSENHASIFKKVSNWWKNIYSFISFSPIPDGHNRKFESVLDCYAHEVPLDGVQLTEADFKFVGVIYNRRGGGKVKKPFLPWKKPKAVPAKLDECIRYVFVVYLVEYRDLKFVGDNGKPNWRDIDLAFAEKTKRGSKRKDRFFLKDHDYIVGADSLIDIASRLTTIGSNESKCWLKVEQEAIRHAKHMVVNS